MAADVNDITIQYEEDGVVIVKEIDKEILSKGAWATVLFRYQQWDMAKTAMQSAGTRRCTVSICRNQNLPFPAASRPKRLSMPYRNGFPDERAVDSV
jgi:hypothetical protein